LFLEEKKIIPFTPAEKTISQSERKLLARRQSKKSVKRLSEQNFQLISFLMDFYKDQK